MDTSAFRSVKTKPLSLADAKRLRKRIFSAVGTNINVFLGVMDMLPGVGITIKSTKGHYLYKNTFALEVINAKDENAILGKRAQDIYPPKTWHIYVDREAQVLAKGKPFTNRIQGFASDLSTKLNSASAFPLRDKDGKVIALLTMFKRASSDFQAPGWHDMIEGSISYINDHFSENLRTASLAKKANLSESRFIRLFSAISGKAPNQYICMVRINAAKVLLETTNKLLTEIAGETGFFDQAHFCKTFKRTTGLTPAKYRKQHWAI